MDQGVEHIGADSVAVGHRLHRAPALQRADHSDQDGDLQQADQQPAGGGIALLQQVAEPRCKHQRLQYGLEQPLLQRRKRFFQPAHVQPVFLIQSL